MTPSSAGAGIRQIEEYAGADSFFHRRHSAANLINCVFFIVVTVSFPKYSFAEILPIALYPLAFFYFTDIPVKPILRRILPVMPLIVGVGIFNPFFDVNTVAIGGMSISSGWISFVSLVLRGFLCATTALLTVSATGVDGISEALSLLCVPKLFITQFILTFRYIQILIDEADRITLSYRLRSRNGKAPGIQEWGALAGSWLLRTLKRADRVYNAMLLKGFSGVFPSSRKGIGLADAAYMVLCCGYFIIVRTVSIPNVINSILL